MRALLICVLALAANASEPVVEAWIRSRPAPTAELRKLLPEVHDVMVEDDYVEVRSAGLSLLYLGPFQNPLSADGGLRDLRFRIPRRPVLQDGPGQRIGPGAMGVFLNGVPLYNRLAEASYLGRSLWHFDTVRRPQSLGVLEEMIANRSAHSPILGFALDGFPMYGPWAGSRRMRSGYRLRRIRERTSWADGTKLTPGQYGPPVDAQFPLGTFAEDYEYRPDAGDLDSSNGRFAVTPEYPNGTYAYYLTTDDAGQLAFPYLLTDRFRGRLPVAPRAANELRFTFPGAQWLEIVHEKPIHLMVVSADLAWFDHIHPEWQPGNYYAVTYAFPHAGKYRLFAQFTLPGEAERVESYDVDVPGDPRATPPAAEQPIAAKLVKPDRIRTGEDVSLTVELSGAPIEPYLGAWAHFVLLDRHLENFIHAHPAGAIETGQDVHVAAGPPPSSVSFTTNFAQPGIYKLWAQFQVAGKMAAIPFDVEVNAGAIAAQTAAIPADAIRVQVDAQGFTPARIEAAESQPVTLAITRAAAPNCASRIVFPALGIERDLPVGQTTVIELPKLTGDLTFSCGMGMFRGMIVAR